MSNYIDKVTVGGTTYDIQDSGSREEISDLDDRVTILETGGGTDLDIAEFSRLVYKGLGAVAGPVGTAIVTNKSDTPIYMNVLDHDYHTPVSSNIPHTCTLGMRDVFELRQFDAPEALFYVDPTAYPNGLQAGTRYYITLDHGAYDGDTGEDGSYGFTPVTNVPKGGYVRHSTMGASHSPYQPSKITDGKFITYNTQFVQIEQLDTDTGTDGTSLGTATAKTYQGNSAHVNFTQRNAYGNNRVDQSAWLQYANASGTGWWSKKNEWDFPPTNYTTIQGFLTELDADMIASMVKVKIRFALADCDGGGACDIETFVFPLSMTEVNFGHNNSQYETSWGINNTLKEVPLAFYDGATNADRIKTMSNTARTWFLRGTLPSFAHIVRGVYTTGGLGHSIADYANGFVAAWCIGNPVITSA